MIEFPPLRARGLLTLAGSVKILHGDVRARLRDLPDESIHCVVTSPPYYNLRRYHEDPVWEGGDPDCAHAPVDNDGSASLCRCGARLVMRQIGLEETVDDYVEALVKVFREIRRVLRKDGTAWLVIGDSYAKIDGRPQDNHGNPDSLAGRAPVEVLPDNRKRRGTARKHSPAQIAASTLQNGMISPTNSYFHRERPDERAQGQFLKTKDLYLVPHRVGLALQRDGWYVRNDVVWHKAACLPESVTDRMTAAHEHIWLLAKSERYFYDHEAIREEIKPWTQATLRASSGVLMDDESQQHQHAGVREYEELKGANRRDVWTLHAATIPTPEDHPAMFPLEIPTLAIQAGTSEAGVCPHCGAPWARRKREPQQWVQGTKASRSRPDNRAMIDSRYRDGLAQPGLKEFAPTCGCPTHRPVAAVVLDPFGGAGTTGLAAAVLGRNAVLVELSAKYASGIVGRLQREDVRVVVDSPDLRLGLQGLEPGPVEECA